MSGFIDNLNLIKKNRKDFNEYVLKQTNKYQKKYGFEIGTGSHATWNNEADAFKHAYMQWYLSYKYNNSISKGLGDYHENETPNAPIGERNMDLWNNAIGREIAHEMKQNKDLDLLNEQTIEDFAASKIIERMKSGEMITNPNDKRRFENMELERLSDKDRVFYKNEMNNFDQKIKDLYSESFLDQAIDEYWKVPTRDELDNRVKAGNLIYVENYTRSDGTKVNGYYRRKPTF